MAKAKTLEKQVATRIDGDLAKLLAERAERDDRSEASIIRRALREFLTAKVAA